MATRPAELSLNKHQLKTEATRAKLLKSARRIFARSGFESASIEDIAAHAGYSRGAFYAHFNTKEDLFFALLEQQSKENTNKLKQVLASCSTPDGSLEALRNHYVRRAADRHWVMLLLEFKLFALRHGKLRANWASIHSQIRESVKLELGPSLLPGIDRNSRWGELRKVALEVALNGVALEHAYDPKRVSEEDVDDLLRHVFDLLVQPDSVHCHSQNSR